MTEREQFEAWWNEAAYTSDTLAKHEQNIAWCAWQAARAAAPAEPTALEAIMRKRFKIVDAVVREDECSPSPK